jgi:hypothetical protein
MAEVMYLTKQLPEILPPVTYGGFLVSWRQSEQDERLYTGMAGGVWYLARKLSRGFVIRAIE